MDYNIINFKFLITILSSSNTHLLKLSYNTVIQQLNNPLNYNIIIVINSLDTSYYNQVLQEFKDIDVQIIQTKSNGKPGMGHNSCIDIFKTNLQYDYLIHLDGDDFLYPYAFHQIYKSFDFFKKNNHIYPDIFVLQGNDLISWYNESTASSDIYLNNSFYLIKQDEYPENKWLFNKDIININPFNSNTFITPIRPFIYSRNIFKLNIDNFFCTKSSILDDYLFYLHFINIFITKTLHISIINSQHIYLYNDCNINSVQKTYSIQQDYKHIKSYKSQFYNIIDYFKDEWNPIVLPYINIPPPFNNIYIDYKIFNNSIQIVNYDSYLDNQNTTYCIHFAKKIAIKLFNIFKFNLDDYLSNNNYKKTYELSSILINNHIQDPEIYNFLCLSLYFLKDYTNIYKHIHKAIPYCNNYDFLKQFL